MISTRSDPSPPLVMVFAASDPTGGAGIQADIMTLSGMGCHALTVITALTVQDTAGVEAVLPTDAEFVDEQARALLEDMPEAPGLNRKDYSIESNVLGISSQHVVEI